MRSLFIAMSFLTVVPLRLRDVKDTELAASTSVFPLVGLIKGSLLYILSVILKDYLSAGLLSWLVVVFYVFLTGALHLDGLSDTFDAIALRGPKEKKFIAMKDSRAGPAGVVSLVLLVLGKFLIIKEAVLKGMFPVMLFFPVAGCASMALGIGLFSPARDEGLGSLFIKHAGSRVFVLSLFWTFTITLVFGVLFEVFFHVISAMVISLFTGYLFGVFINRHLGGHTGDTLGALAETTEVAFLFFYMVV